MLGTENEESKTKLPQEVVIKDAGPCRKHVTVTVDRKAIDEKIEERFSKLMIDTPAQVPGFRPGKAPRKIIEKKYIKEVTSEVKTEVLLASLEQLADEQTISPLSPPDLDPYSIEIPASGPFVYEFNIEVRPEFDLPDYKNLHLRRPIHTANEAEISRAVKRFLEPIGKVVPKEADSIVELDDMIVADAVIRHEGREINTIPNVTLRVESRIALSDGAIEDFAKNLKGAKIGETRSADVKISSDARDTALRGANVKADFTVKEIKTVQIPELTSELLSAIGVRSVEQLREVCAVRIEMNHRYSQRQVLRAQVLEKLGGDQKWELPQDMLERQVRRTLQRKVLEMRSAGMSDEQINARGRYLENDAIRSTQAALKEHFVLQKVAELEKLEIEDEDLDAEIERIAEQNNESPRKVRARMEREDLLEPLATELLEQKALELILSTATYDDYEMTQDESSAADTTSVDATLTKESAPVEPAAESAS